MDIKELDKKQLVLLTLLITFVVSIATGIVTVSLMKQMPSSVPQTINNVIQRTIEKVTTVEVPATTKKENVTSNENNSTDKSVVGIGNGDALISIYLNNKDTTNTSVDNTISTDGTVTPSEPAAIGQGIIISEVGLILVDSSLVNDTDSYKVILDKTEFNATILKKFGNGFTVLKISPITPVLPATTDTANKTQ